MRKRLTRAELEYENDLNGEAIMLMRWHLERAGVEADFADDVAAIAANRLLSLEAAVCDPGYVPRWERR